LNDLEQDVSFRGIIPDADQPNHTANLWKCDYSHPQIAINGAGNPVTSFSSDFITPLRGAKVAQDVCDTSRAHLISRFGSMSS
jgi:hypothetical protein